MGSYSVKIRHITSKKLFENILALRDFNKLQNGLKTFVIGSSTQSLSTLDNRNLRECV